MIIEARDVEKSFGQTPALRGATVDAKQGEILAIMGPSGSGKSTLLHCLAGILTPDRGEVWFDGQRLDTLKEAQRSELRAVARAAVSDGDAPARGVSRLAGGAIAWARRTHRVIGENIAEYLKEESRDLVARPEVEEFLHGVDQVREAADRVEARLQGLQRRLQGGV